MRKLLVLLFLIATNCYSKPILISFDGSAVLDVWQDTLDFAKNNHLKFTYFVSAPFFVSGSEVAPNPYWAETEIGTSYLKFRKDAWRVGIDKRWAYVKRAVAEGHEIGSHLCGHYDGSNWTYEQWMKEMSFFKWALNRQGFDFGRITGIRAPYLATNKDYFRAVKDSGYIYDSSLVYYKRTPYTKHEIPIRQISVYGTKKTTLPFDCNFMLFNFKDPGQAYYESLCYDYFHNPLPTQVCLHFQQQEGDPYLNAMKRFVLWVADKNPQYMTYKEYSDSLQ